MPKPTIMLVQRTKEEGGEIGLSFHEAEKLVQEQLVPISKMRRSLHSMSTLFKGKADILPAQCKRVISSLEKLNANVQLFCVLLNEEAELPPTYKVLRYRLTSVLYLIEEQSNEVAELIDSFLDTYMTSSTATRQQRKEIYTALESLLGYIDDILQRAEAFNYEAHLLQKKWSIAFQEELGAVSDVKDVPSKSRLRLVK